MNKSSAWNVRGVVVASVATAAGMFATLANAEDTSKEAPSAVVKYGDLNLATEKGANTLYHRIVLAAEKVCPTNFTRDLGQIARARNCQADAVARAVHQVNSPQLAMLHERRSGHG